MLRDLTTIPRTTPRFLTTFRLGSSSAVVTMWLAMAWAMRVSLGKVAKLNSLPAVFGRVGQPADGVALENRIVDVMGHFPAENPCIPTQTCPQASAAITHLAGRHIRGLEHQLD